VVIWTGYDFRILCDGEDGERAKPYDGDKSAEYDRKDGAVDEKVWKAHADLA
jgi:hypothetical protein